MNPPHPIYHWFIHLLAKALEVDVFYIRTEKSLKELLEAVVCNMRGIGKYRNVQIEFDPANQTLTYTCESPNQALEIEEALGKKSCSIYGNIIVQDVPRNFFFTGDNGKPIFPPEVRIPGVELGSEFKTRTAR